MKQEHPSIVVGLDVGDRMSQVHAMDFETGEVLAEGPVATTPKAIRRFLGRIPEDTWDYNKTGAKEPPYNLDDLCVFLEINTWHYRCVKAKAISTAGFGFDMVTPEGVNAALE